jgi:hypothetical protein
VSHCIHDLDWLSSFVHGVDVPVDFTIISKCGAPVVGAPKISKIIRLPNVGRCDHSYAYWLAHENVYISADEEDKVAVVFLKDDVSWSNLHQVGDWQTLRELLQVSSVRGFACGVEPSKFGIEEDMLSLSLYHKWSHLADFGMKTYSRTREGYRDQEKSVFKADFESLGDWVYNTVGIEVAQSFGTVLPVCYGGVFAATAANINKRNVTIWENIERSLARGDNIEEGHFAGK